MSPPPSAPPPALSLLVPTLNERENVAALAARASSREVPPQAPVRIAPAESVVEVLRGPQALFFGNVDRVARLSRLPPRVREHDESIARHRDASDRDRALLEEGATITVEEGLFLRCHFSDRLIEEGLMLQPRWGYPSDVGKAVAMLARGDLPYSTGQVIMVDGGMLVDRL